MAHATAATTSTPTASSSARRPTCKLGIEADFIPGREDRMANLLEAARVGLRRRLGPLPRRARRRLRPLRRVDERPVARQGVEHVLRLARRGGAQRPVRHPRPPGPREDVGRPSARGPRAICAASTIGRWRASPSPGIAVEVSTAGLRKPTGSIYPDPAFLEMVLDAGNPIALSSDAHAPDQLGFRYEDALEYLERPRRQGAVRLRGPRAAPGADRRVVSVTTGIGWDVHRLESRPRARPRRRAPRARPRPRTATPTPTCSPTR